MQIPSEIYYELCDLMKDFERSTTVETDEDYLSDGEWLDAFYYFCKKLKESVK